MSNSSNGSSNASSDNSEVIVAIFLLTFFTSFLAVIIILTFQQNFDKPDNWFYKKGLYNGLVIWGIVVAITMVSLFFGWINHEDTE